MKRILRAAAVFLSSSLIVGAEQSTTPQPTAGSAQLVKFQAARELPTSYAEASSQSHSRSLASADFEEDGMPDLVCGYSTAVGGVVTLQRGNVEAVYGALANRSPGHFRSEPFFPEAKVFPIPASADFMGAGDFDADGHWDLITARRGDNALYWLRGDGRGGFSVAQRIELPGIVSTLATGDINRADGLTDVAVGIMGSGGAQVVIYESPEGALKAPPEIISLPAQAMSLAMEQADSDGFADLFVTTSGLESLVVSGRDRKLSLSADHQASVEKATVLRRSRPAEGFTTTSAIATVVAEPTAVIPVRLNADARTGFVVLSEHRVGPALVTLASGATYVVNSTGDGADANLADGVCADGAGACTLRAAIQQANASGGATIHFGIASGPQTLIPATQLPNITTPVVIDGTSQPGFAGTPIIELTRGATIDGLVFRGGSEGSSVRGLVLNSVAANPGIRSAIVLANNGNNVVTGNYIGTNIAGDAARSNGRGITIACPNNTIGGTVAQARNLISGNASGAIYIGFNGVPASTTGYGNNTIQGNYIGTNAIGNGVLNNGLNQNAIYVASSNNQIGGTVSGARNVIAGHGSGIRIQGGGDVPVDGNLIQGNSIGTDVSGRIDLGNASGVQVLDSSSFIPKNNTIGGTTTAARNVISGNTNGVVINGAADTLVQGNYIGTTADGLESLGGSLGVSVSNFDGPDTTTIGGVVAGAGNVISGYAIGIQTTSIEINAKPVGQAIQGNFIGTNARGDAALPNVTGIQMATPITVGGATAGAGNVISGNTTLGIDVRDNSSVVKGNFIIQGNFIGTQADGVSPLGNGQSGIRIVDGNGTLIGGIGAGEGNVIAFNGRTQTTGDGVDLTSLSSPTGHQIRGNSIFSNGSSASGQGIDLAPDGLNNNDACDTDSGANLRQNFPVLSAASFRGSSTTITGSLESTANTVFAIDFYSSPACEASGRGEGQTYLGSATVATDASSCAKVFSVTLTQTPLAGSVVTATATDPAGNTSEFSPCIAAVPGKQPPIASDDSVTTSEETPVAVAVLANDSDPDGDPFSITSFTQGASGSVVRNADQTLTYTPNPNFAGADSFAYTITDSDGNTDTATVRVTVQARVNRAPQANNGAFATYEDVFLILVPLSASDADGDALTYSRTDPQHGTLSGTAPNLFYRPAPDFNGTDSFTFRVHDGQVYSNVATVVINIAPVNDRPSALDGSWATNQNTDLTIDLRPLVADRETADENLSYVKMSDPAHGTVTVTGQTFTYRPTDPKYHGPDSFSYRVTDRGDPDNCGAPGANCSAPLSSVIRTISLRVNSTNRRPVAESQTVTTDEDARVEVTLQGADVDREPLTFSIVRNPAHGTLSGVSTVTCGIVCAAKVTYSPALNYLGRDSFTFRVNDGQTESLVATVSITVKRVGKIAFTSTRDGNHEIYVMHEDGSSQRRLTFGTQSSHRPAWSPNGTKIAFERGQDIWIMNADGSDQINLTPPRALGQLSLQPVWSSRGEIAFSGMRENRSNIYVMAADGTGVRQLTFNESATPENFPAWSPDGLELAFTTSREGNAEIYAMDLNGGNLRNLTNNRFRFDADAAWSPDGSMLAFGDLVSVWLMNRDGSSQRRLQDNAFAPSWSPGGSQLAFWRKRAAGDGSGDIWVMNSADGSVATQITNNGNDSDPAWRPGSAYRFIGPVGGNWNERSNWQPRGVPGRYDAAMLAAGQSALVQSDVVVGTLSMTEGAALEGAADGTGSVTVTQRFDFTGGGLSGTRLIIAIGAELIISGEATKSLSRTVIDNRGTTTISGSGAIASDVEGVFNNKGLFTFGLDRLQETLEREGATAHFGRFNNSSKVLLNGGTLTVLEGYDQASGETDLGNALANEPAVLAGTINGNATISGGSLTGWGRINGDLVNASFVLPGHSGGIITVTGNYTQTATGVLVIELGGFDGSEITTQFDQLRVGGVASFDGRLDVRAINGFRPGRNDVLAPITYGSQTGSFASVSENTAVELSAGELSLTLDAAAPAPKPGQSLNISTRGRVATADQLDRLLIAGLIVQGPPGSAKKVILRAIGPSLTQHGVAGALADPILTLYDSTGAAIASNHNWKDSQREEIEATTIPPSDDREAAIVATLPSGAYTAIVHGAGESQGVALVEVYDLDPASEARLANLSTRGQVETGENVMIGGFIVGGTEPAKMLVRAIGPSLAEQGLTNVLRDPELTLVDSQGNAVGNNNWRGAQENEIVASTIPPTNDSEAAILATLVPGAYTAVVRGVNETSGTGLVEVYNLR